MTKLFDLRYSNELGYWEICTALGSPIYWEPAATFWIKHRIPFRRNQGIDDYYTLAELLMMEGWEPPNA